VQHNCTNGGGGRSTTISEDFREAKTLAQIMCSSCNVSQSPIMYQWKWAQVSWWPFSPPCEEKDKQQEKKNKNAC
jgi:hypothetical protein